MNNIKLYKLHIGDVITISEPYLKLLLKKVKYIRTDKFNIFNPKTWFKKRFYTIEIMDLK